METDSTCPDIQDYWNEFSFAEEIRLLDEDESPQDGECQEERDWLQIAGLGDLTEPAFLSGQEISDEDLDRMLHNLSRGQAAAVRRRVASLNKTVRQVQRQTRHQKTKKPDIRYLFRDHENWSNDSRSRSATPDSLDSDPPSPPSPLRPSENLNLLRFNPAQLQRNESRRRAANANPPVLPPQALFRRSSRSGGDIVASEMAEGIRMVGYQRIGSVRVRERTKSESDPLLLNSLKSKVSSSPHPAVCVTRSHDSLFDGPRRLSEDSSSPKSDTVGFEEMWAGGSLPVSLNNNNNNGWFSSWEESDSGKTRVEYLAEEDLATLRPLLFVELTAIMDQSGINVGKVKPQKKKKKEDGLLFGLSLTALLERDEQISSEPRSVPLIFQKVLGELEKRALFEEGVLRVAGNKQKVEVLCSQLDRDFYSKHEVADYLISTASVHELTTLLKRLIKLLPQPLLTSELLHLFYHSYGTLDSGKALNLLVLLLPTDHRATLYSILTFLSNIIAHQGQNKMSAHNVAMIMAPSLFPPNILVAKSGLKAELGLAVQCCKLTELMMQNLESLWIVPESLITQLRRINQSMRKENRWSSLGKTGSLIIDVEAPQFVMSSLRIALHEDTSAGEIILRAVDISRDSPRCAKSSKRDIKARALSELAPNGNLSCLLSTGDPDTALQTHFLYEVGGNIAQRRLEQSAKVLRVLENNPSASWVVRCDHRSGSHRILRRT